MKAFALFSDAPDTLRLADFPTPVPGAGQALLQVRAAALNRRDYWISQGKYARIQYPAVLGSDLCAVVESVGSDEDAHWVGKRVIVNPGFNWGESEQYKSRDFHVLGMPTQGAFAEYLCVATQYLYEAPEHLDDAQAAALPLSGVTAYRALVSTGGAHAGSSVFVSGVGGGTAQMAFLLARALGAKVWVSTGNAAKLERALELGAEGGVNYREDAWARNFVAESGGVDLIIDSAGGDQIDDLLGILKPGGTLVFYGATLGTPSKLNLHRMFWNQLSLRGSTMGSPRDFAAMLALVRESKLVPIVDSSRPFSELPAAFERLAENTQFGKIVVVMNGQ